MEDYADERKACQMKEYDDCVDIPLQKKYREQIMSVVVSYGVSMICESVFFGRINL